MVAKCYNKWTLKTLSHSPLARRNHRRNQSWSMRQLMTNHLMMQISIVRIMNPLLKYHSRSSQTDEEALIALESAIMDNQERDKLESFNWIHYGTLSFS